MSGTVFPPPAAVLKWPPPNFINPETHGPALLVLCCTIGPIAFLMTFARLWARFVIQRNAGIDDWLMAIGLIPLLALLIIIGIMSQNYGFDKHIWDNPIMYYVPVRKLAFAAEISYLLASCFIKSSILLFYRRLSKRTISKAFILVTKITLATVVLATIAYLVALFESCRYLFSYWYSTDLIRQMTGAQFGCTDEYRILVSAFVVTTAHDFIVTTLPFLLFWNLQIPLRQKIALNAIFAVGYIVCGLSGMRLYYIYMLFHVTFDATWTAWYIFLWMLLEMMVAAMCASAPALKVFFSYHFNSTTADSLPPTPHKNMESIGIRRSIIQSRVIPSDSLENLTGPRNAYAVHVYARESDGSTWV